MYSPSPCSLFLRHLSARASSIHKTRIATAFSLALFFLLLNISYASAQTRARRARAGGSAKGSARANDKKRADAGKRDDDKRSAKRADDRKRSKEKERAASARRTTPADKSRVDDRRRTTAPVETARRDNSKQVVANPLVRKTALTYAPNTGGQAAKRPALVNDVIVISRASDKPSSPVLVSDSLKTSGTSASNIPSIWPVMGTLRSGVGMRGNPFGGPGTEYHKGQDISAPMGTPVMATADGTILIAGWQRGYGWVVYIDHGNGISTRYGHLSRIDVAVGQTIKRGEQLGLVGSTGRSTGPHLHYEVRINGQPVSPLRYLPYSPALSSAQPQSATPSAQK